METMVERTNTETKITVLIAAYCSEKTLPGTMASVLRQDYPHVEIILCDDGTPFFTVPERCEERTIVMHQFKNVGTVRNLNAGLRRATGEWVMCLAGDDALASETVLSELIRCANGTKKNWVLGKTQLCNNVLRPTNKFLPTEQETYLLQSGKAAYVELCRRCFIPACGTLFRKSLLEKYHAFDERCRLVEDWPLFLQLLRSNELPGLCNNVTVFRRAGGVSGSTSAKNQSYQKDLITVMEKEILPNLHEIPPQKRHDIEKICRDKAAIYQLRFEINGLFGKVCWICTHLGVIYRRLFYRK